jgi:hypothetical protein
VKLELTTLLIALSLSLGGCKQKDAEPSAPLSTATAVATPLTVGSAALAAPDAGGDADSLPTEEDFEDEVNQTITSKNLDAELDKLEREIGSNP